MSETEPQFLDLDGRRIAVRAAPAPQPRGAGLFWLSGYASDMESTKATELARFATGRFGMTRFDYSGCGLSGGDFAEGTIGRWLEEALAVFRVKTTGPQVIVGSSMGGYLALLMLKKLIETAPGEADRVRALVLIAPAWDMTEALIWRVLTPYQQAAIMTEGSVLRPTGGDPQLITRALIEEGRRHLLGGLAWGPGRPVHVLQGLGDDVVPPEHVRKLNGMLSGGHLVIEEIEGGDHRLSRAEDIARLCEVAGHLAG